MLFWRKLARTLNQMAVMADDGLLLNFDFNVTAIESKPIFKGGKWKDRLIAKRGTRYRERRIASGVNAVATNEQSRKERPNEEGNFPRPIGSSNNANDDSDRPLKRPRLTANTVSYSTLKPSTEVISSLFTSNPTSKPSPALKATQFAPLPPSNAPLPSSLTNSFTALGFSPLLASQLVAKLKLTSPTAIQSLTLPHLVKTDTDAFIRAETGSGKTLAYLLPIIQRIVGSCSPSSSTQRLSRTSGLYALILAPTRDLARQIHTVLIQLLAPYPYFVSGLVLGGEKKKSEKARLRKGINILVATPGRLVDHLDNTEVLNLGGVRWLVLDEGDRLMEMGFEDDVRRVIEALGEREIKENDESRGADLPKRRVTILCSATLKEGARKLGDLSLRDAKMIAPEPEQRTEAKDDDDSIQVKEKTNRETINGKGGTSENNGSRSPESDAKAGHIQADANASKTKEAKERFQAPSQLQQSYIISPPKQRLVTLLALLKSTFNPPPNPPQTPTPPIRKVLIFFSCADSVDFCFQILAQTPSSPTTDSQPTSPSTSPSTGKKPSSLPESIAPTPHIPTSPLLHRLHGSLPQPLRTSTLAAFSTTTSSSILLCTDVASRGLDLADIDLVIEYDPPFSRDDHLHRVGRTARAGKAGEAVVFLMTGPEEGYVPILEKCIASGDGDGDGDDDAKQRLTRRTAEEVLKAGFSYSGNGAKPKSNIVATKKNTAAAGLLVGWEEAATGFQLAVERYIASTPRMLELARKAYISHVRAYATHVKDERQIFDVKALHLGHLAKAFGLRERPGKFGRGGEAAKVGKKRRFGDGDVVGKGRKKAVGDGDGDDDNVNGEVKDVVEARRKMRAMAKMQGAGASEFNLG